MEYEKVFAQNIYGIKTFSHTGMLDQSVSTVKRRYNYEIFKT